MSNKKITAIVELDKSTYKTKIYADGHFIYADEPEDLGGTNEGMPPACLLLASLGSCTAITLRMYADRKKMALDAVKIELEITEATALNEGTVIERRIELIGTLSEDERKRLLLIADKCPIHKILTNPITINSSLAK